MALRPTDNEMHDANASQSRNRVASPSSQSAHNLHNFPDSESPEIPEEVRLETAAFTAGLFFKHGLKIPSQIMAMFPKNESFIEILVLELQRSTILCNQAFSEKDPTLPKPQPPKYLKTASGISGTVIVIPNLWLDVILTMNWWKIFFCVMGYFFRIALTGVEAMGLLLISVAGENTNTSPDKARYEGMAAGITMVLRKPILARVFSLEEVSLDGLRAKSDYRRRVRQLKQAKRDAQLSEEVWEKRLAANELGQNLFQWTTQNVEEVGKFVFDAFESVSPRALVRQSIDEAKLFGLNIDSNLVEDTAAKYLDVSKLVAEALYNVFAGFHISSTGDGQKAGGRGGAVACVFCGLATGFLRAITHEMTIRWKEKKDISKALAAGTLEDLGEMAYEDKEPDFNNFWRFLWLATEVGLSVAASFALSEIVRQGNDPTSGTKIVDSVITRLGPALMNYLLALLAVAGFFTMSLDIAKLRLKSDESLRIAQFELQKRVNLDPQYPPNANVYQILYERGLTEAVRTSLQPTIPEDAYRITTNPPDLRYNKELLARAFLWALGEAAPSRINDTVITKKYAASYTATGELIDHSNDKRAKRFRNSLGKDEIVKIETKTKAAELRNKKGAIVMYTARWTSNKCDIRSGNREYSFIVARLMDFKDWEREQLEWTASWMLAVDPDFVRCDLEEFPRKMSVKAARFFCERLTERNRRRLRGSLEREISSYQQPNLLKYYQPGEPILYRTETFDAEKTPLGVKGLRKLLACQRFSVRQMTPAMLYKHADGFFMYTPEAIYRDLNHELYALAINSGLVPSGVEPIVLRGIKLPVRIWQLWEPGLWPLTDVKLKGRPVTLVPGETRNKSGEPKDAPGQIYVDLLQFSRFQYAAITVEPKKYGFFLADEPRPTNEGIDSFYDALALSALDPDHEATVEQAEHGIRDALRSGEATRVTNIRRRLGNVIQHILEQYSKNPNGLSNGFRDVLAEIDLVISQTEHLKLVGPIASPTGTAKHQLSPAQSEREVPGISGRARIFIGPQNPLRNGSVFRGPAGGSVKRRRCSTEEKYLLGVSHHIPLNRALLLEFLDDLLEKVVSTGFLSVQGVTNQEYGFNDLIIGHDSLEVWDYDDRSRRFHSSEILNLAALQQLLTGDQTIIVFPRQRRVRDDAGETYILYQRKWLSDRTFCIHVLGVRYDGEIGEQIVSSSRRKAITDFVVLAIAQVTRNTERRGVFGVPLRVNVNTRTGSVKGLFPELLPTNAIRQRLENEIGTWNLNMDAGTLRRKFEYLEDHDPTILPTAAVAIQIAMSTVPIHTGQAERLTVEHVWELEVDEDTSEAHISRAADNTNFQLLQGEPKSAWINRELFIRAIVETKLWADEIEIFILQKVGVPLRVWEREQGQATMQLKQVSAPGRGAAVVSEFIEVLRTGDHFVAITGPDWPPPLDATSASIPADSAIRDNIGQGDCFYLAVATAGQARNLSDQVRFIISQTPALLRIFIQQEIRRRLTSENTEAQEMARFLDFHLTGKSVLRISIEEG